MQAGGQVVESKSFSPSVSQAKHIAPHILVVEDEPEILDLLEFTLTRAGYDVVGANSAEQAIQRIDERIPRLVVIDWMLPGMNGIDLAKYIRRDELIADLPLIMLTARSEEADTLKSFDSGIDDYITKPFSPRELVARIKSLLRRSELLEDDHLEACGIDLDLSNFLVKIHGNSVHLGPTEFRLLAYLLQHKDKTFSRSQLLDRVWGRTVYIEERTVDVHVLRLRKALKPYGVQDRLQTVRGFGYRFSSIDD
jgi:two-component system phosphate regulon response regulator PhoB